MKDILGRDLAVNSFVFVYARKSIKVGRIVGTKAETKIRSRWDREQKTYVKNEVIRKTITVKYVADPVYGTATSKFKNFNNILLVSNLSDIPADILKRLD